MQAIVVCLQTHNTLAVMQSPMGGVKCSLTHCTLTPHSPQVTIQGCAMLYQALANGITCVSGDNNKGCLHKGSKCHLSPLTSHSCHLMPGGLQHRKLT